MEMSGNNRDMMGIYSHWKMHTAKLQTQKCASSPLSPSPASPPPIVGTYKKYFISRLLLVSVEMGSVKHKKADSQIYSQGQILSGVQGKMSSRGEQLLLMAEKVVIIHWTAALPGWKVKLEAPFDYLTDTE